MRLTAVALMGLYGILLLLHPSSSFASSGRGPGPTQRRGAAAKAAAEAQVESASASTRAPPATTSTMTSTSASSEAEAEPSSSEPPTPLPDISTFGLNLFAELTTKEGSGRSNVLVSPLSVAQSLALLTAGATPSSQCQTELCETLGVQSHADLPRLTESLLSSSLAVEGGATNTDLEEEDVSLTTANSVWLASSIKPTFAELATTVHSATTHPLPQTFAPMNDWVSNSTHGLITDLFEPSQALDELVRAYLLNVIYFKGSWKQRFDVEQTTVGTFHKSDGSEISPVNFMRTKRDGVRIGYQLDTLGGATVVELTYGKLREVTNEEYGFTEEVPSDYSALFVLPADEGVESMDGTIAALAQLGLTDVMHSMYPREVRLELPRFKLEWGTSSLKESLRVLGVHDAFDGTDVLLGMSDDTDLHVDDVLHKAVMEVTEEGTVAAAATAVKIQTRSLPPPPVEVKFNRPFVVAIVHRPTGTPVFLGRVEDPNLTFDSVE